MAVRSRKVARESHRRVQIDMVVHRRVGLREVAAEMDAARLASGGSGGNHEPGDGEHVLEGPAGRVLELQREDVAAPVVDAVGGFSQTIGVPGDPQSSPQEGAERLAQVADVDPVLAIVERRRGQGGTSRGRGPSSSRLATMSSAARAP